MDEQSHGGEGGLREKSMTRKVMGRTNGVCFVQLRKAGTHLCGYCSANSCLLQQSHEEKMFTMFRTA